MSFEDIARQMKITDNYVSSGGMRCLLMISSIREFYSLFWNYRRTMIYPQDFTLLLIERFQSHTLNERKNEIRKQKLILLSLMKESGLSNLYFTPNIEDMARRIVDLSDKDIYYLPMTKFDFIPEGYHTEMENLKDRLMRINCGSMQLIHWRYNLYVRYVEVLKLEKLSRYKWSIMEKGMILDRTSYVSIEKDLGWRIKESQLINLLKLFKRYFSNHTDVRVIAKILLYSEVDGNIIWMGRTEALVYFFTQLVEQNYIYSKDWGMVFMNKLLFCSKKGNIITNRNINATLDRLKNKETTTKEFKVIKQKLIDFKNRNGPFLS